MSCAGEKKPAHGGLFLAVQTRYLIVLAATFCSTGAFDFATVCLTAVEAAAFADAGAFASGAGADAAGVGEAAADFIASL